MSDHHLGHEGMCRFVNADGSKVRPHECAEDMYVDMRDRHNAIVQPADRVYMLGDVAIKRQSLQLLATFNGRKVLIKGNHDIFKLKDYLPWFDDIRASWYLNNYLLTHIPVHPASKSRFSGNIHGHVHSNTLEDQWYYNCCPEAVGYAPRSFEQIMQDYERRQYA